MNIMAIMITLAFIFQVPSFVHVAKNTLLEWMHLGCYTNSSGGLEKVQDVL